MPYGTTENTRWMDLLTGTSGGWAVGVDGDGAVHTQWIRKDENMGIPLIKKVIFNDPVTVVIWKDDTKTICRCTEDTVFDEDAGLAMCIAKKYFGSRSKMKKALKGAWRQEK